MSNLSKVQAMYAAFGQGDIPTVLNYFSNDIVLVNESDPKRSPIGGEFKGKEGAIQYFTAIGNNIQTTDFVPSNFREEGNIIVNDIIHAGIATSTGKPFSAHLTFTWNFNNQGEAEHWIGAGDYETLYEAFAN